MKRAYRFRFYPTEAQKAVLARTFGCVRVVYNFGLRLRTEAHYKRRERLGYPECSAALTLLKRQEEYLWLNEVSSVPLQQSLRHLDRAFQNFFEGRARYPRRKRKRGRQSAEYTRSAFRFDGKDLFLAKMEEPIRIRWSRRFTGTPSTVSVQMDTAGGTSSACSWRRISLPCE